MSNSGTQNNNQYADVLRLWDETPETKQHVSNLIPAGKYKAYLAGGEFETASTGSKCFKITWELVDGTFAGKRLVSRYWLTEKAISRSKGELIALGINTDHLLGKCPPPRVMAELCVVQQNSDGWGTKNEVKWARSILHEANPPMVSQDAPQAANGQAVKSASVEVSQTSESKTQMADDDAFLDKEF